MLPIEKSPRASCLALCFAISYPTLFTLVYFIILKDWPPTLQIGTFGIGKALQFLFPLAYVLFILGSRPRRSPRPAAGLGSGLLFGAVVMGVALLFYFLWLDPTGVFEGDPVKQIRSKIEGWGLTLRWKFVLLSLFYALMHSFLEEYYWRWFVFRQLRERISLGWSISISSLGFTAHHVVLLVFYFKESLTTALLFCAAIAVGGGVWAWLYDRHKSLLGPWLSHALVDVAIFIIGYHLVRDMFN